MPRKPRSGYLPAVRPQTPPPPAVRLLPPPQREALDRGDDDEPAPRKRSKGLSDEEFQAIVHTAIENGRRFDQDQLQGDRLRAYSYYRGDMDQWLPPDPNGSKVVSYDVRDMVHAVLPSLMRIFSTGSIIEFIPQRERDERFAELASKYVNKLILDQLGDVGLRTAIMDGLLAKGGNVTWWWDDATDVITEKLTGLDEATFAWVTTQEVDETEIEVVEDTIREIPPDPEELAAVQDMIAAGQQIPMPQGTKVHDCTIRVTRQKRSLRVAPFPPEEHIVDSRAASLLNDCAYRGRRMSKRVYELVALGYDRDEVLEHMGAGMDTEADPLTSQDRAIRSPGNMNQIDDDIPDEDYREVEYCELTLRADRDGDGIAELIKVCTIGDTHHIVHEEPAVQICMATAQPIPMPHNVAGRAFADNLIDVQDIKTALWRGTMFSLPNAITPRPWGVEGQVNWDDYIDGGPGDPIRVKNPNAIGQLTSEFVGSAALEVMKFIDENVRDQRTGVSKAAQGLDPDALQSTAASAASSMVGMTQSQLEDYARMIAATLFVPLARGLLREIVQNQNTPDWMKVNDEWVKVDPRTWNADMTCTVDVTGGTHGAAQKLPVLANIAAAQQAAMTQLGPNNPLVGLAEVYNVQKRIVELSGVGRIEQFWKNPAKMPDWTPPPPPGQQGQAGMDPAALAKAEVDKAKIVDQTKRWEIQNQNDRERDKIEADSVLKAFELAGKFGMDPNVLAMVVLQIIRTPRPDQTEPAPPNPHDPIGQLPAQLGAPQLAPQGMNG